MKNIHCTYHHNVTSNPSVQGSKQSTPKIIHLKTMQTFPLVIFAGLLQYFFVFPLLVIFHTHKKKLILASTSLLKFSLNCSTKVNTQVIWRMKEKIHLIYRIGNGNNDTQKYNFLRTLFFHYWCCLYLCSKHVPGALSAESSTKSRESFLSLFLVPFQHTYLCK